MGLLEMSLCGGVMILAVAALRAALLGRLPKRIFPLLWTAVLLRLLLPFCIPSDFSVYSLLERGIERQDRRTESEESLVSLPETLIFGGCGISDAMAQEKAWDGIKEPYDTETEAGLGLQDRSSGSLSVAGKVLRALWGIGALCCGIFFVCSYFCSLRKFGMAEPIEDGTLRQWQEGQRLRRRVAVRRCDRIAAPLTYGIFRPVILVPGNAVREDPQKLAYILQHEYVHVCRRDALVKLAMVAALCVHWFNPLVWVMSWLMNRDVELACDEGVLRRCGEDARSGYALTLIAMEERKKSFMPLYNGFCKNAAEERIRSIMKYTEGRDRRIVAAVPLILAVTVFFATSARTDAVGSLEDPAGSLGREAAQQGFALLAGIGGAGDRELPEGFRKGGESGQRQDEEGPDLWKGDRFVRAGMPETVNVQVIEKEEADGIRVRIFAEVLSENSENDGPSEDEKAVRRIASAFWQAYLAGDRETLGMYLTDDYQGEIEIYPQIEDGRFASETLTHEIKGSRIGEKQVGDRCEIWVEFMPGQDGDTLEYLNMVFVKGQEGWRVCFYGLEM